MKPKIHYNAETKTYTVIGGTEDIPLSLWDVKEVWTKLGYPIDKDGAMLIKNGYTLNLYSNCNIAPGESEELDKWLKAHLW